MTIITYRAGVIAADSRQGLGGDGTFDHCEKLFRKLLSKPKREVIIGTAGDAYLGMVFVDWYGSSGAPPPFILTGADLEEDFEVLILDRGKVYTANHLCRPIRVTTPFCAIGSGCEAALAAMHAGADARAAAVIACKVNSTCGLPIVTMPMPGYKPKTKA